MKSSGSGLPISGKPFHSTMVEEPGSHIEKMLLDNKELESNEFCFPHIYIYLENFCGNPT